MFYQNFVIRFRYYFFFRKVKHTLQDALHLDFQNSISKPYNYFEHDNFCIFTSFCYFYNVCLKNEINDQSSMRPLENYPLSNENKLGKISDHSTMRETVKVFPVKRVLIKKSSFSFLVGIAVDIFYASAVRARVMEYRYSISSSL